MPQNTPHHFAHGLKREEHRGVDMNATCLGTDLKEIQGLDERYQMALIEVKKRKEEEEEEEEKVDLTANNKFQQRRRKLTKTLKKSLCCQNRIRKRKPNRKIMVRIPIPIESERYASLLKAKYMHLYRKQKIHSYLSLR